jgi:hypothetical protein
MGESIMRVQAGLTQRDLVLLGWLADHGVLTTEQIAAGLFPSVNFAQRRRRELMSKQLVDRSDRSALTAARIRIAAHARTHPGAALGRWWSAARCQQAGAFTDHIRAGDRVDGTALAYRPTVRPDGHGIFTDQGTSTAFFLEYDTGTEPLSRLVDKVGGYHDLARVTGRLWPVLFLLPGPARERHLHDALNSARTGYPTATAVHGHSSRAPATGLRAEEPGHPAGRVWWLHQHSGGARTLAELSTAITDLARDAA